MIQTFGLDHTSVTSCVMAHVDASKAKPNKDGTSESSAPRRYATHVSNACSAYSGRLTMSRTMASGEVAPSVNVVSWSKNERVTDD